MKLHTWLTYALYDKKLETKITVKHYISSMSLKLESFVRLQKGSVKIRYKVLHLLDIANNS
jgi:hypothetical protein